MCYTELDELKYLPVQCTSGLGQGYTSGSQKYACNNELSKYWDFSTFSTTAYSVINMCFLLGFGYSSYGWNIDRRSTIIYNKFPSFQLTFNIKNKFPLLTQVIKSPQNYDKKEVHKSYSLTNTDTLRLFCRPIKKAGTFLSVSVHSSLNTFILNTRLICYGLLCLLSTRLLWYLHMYVRGVECMYIF